MAKKNSGGGQKPKSSPKARPATKKNSDSGKFRKDPGNTTEPRPKTKRD